MKICLEIDVLFVIILSKTGMSPHYCGHGGRT